MFLSCHVLSVDISAPVVYVFQRHKFVMVLAKLVLTFLVPSCIRGGHNVPTDIKTPGKPVLYDSNKIKAES